MKKAMIDINNKLISMNYKKMCNLLLQIHDELLFEIKEEYIDIIKVHFYK